MENIGKNYMVNKGKWVNYNLKCYSYNDTLPDDMIIPQDWIDQRIVIIKKEIKEEKIKETIKESKKEESKK